MNKTHSIHEKIKIHTFILDKSKLYTLNKKNFCERETTAVGAVYFNFWTRFKGEISRFN